MIKLNKKITPCKRRCKIFTRIFLREKMNRIRFLPLHRFYTTHPTPVTSSSKITDLINKGKTAYQQVRKGLNDLFENIIKANQLNDEIQKNNYIPTRNEHKFLHIVAIDKSKLIKFGAISLILPELLPFLYKLGFDLAPSTFQNKETKVKDINQFRITANYTPLKELLDLISSHQDSLIDLGQSRPEYFLLDNLNSNQVKLMNGFLGLPKRGLNLHSKLKIHLDFLYRDDEILYMKGVNVLDSVELDEALFERGMYCFYVFLIFMESLGHQSHLLLHKKRKKL